MRVIGIASLLSLVPAVAQAHPLDELEPGHWIVVSNNALRDVDPCPTHDCSYTAVEGVSGVIDDWNGGAFATAVGELGSLVAWGGGHNGYFGSEVYVFDLATGLWSRASEPYDNGSGSVAGDCSEQGIYPDGSACPSHTYDRIDYHPPTNRLVILGSTYDPVCGGCPDPYAHAFDFDDGTWSLGASAAGLGWDGQTAYDSTRDVYWFIAAYGVPPLRRYDPNADAWSEHGPQAQAIEISGMGLYDPDHDAFLYGDPGGTQEVFAYDLADPDASSFALVTEGDEEIAGIGQIGFEWDPAEHRVTAWADGADVYTLTPPEDGDWRTAAWTWTRIPAADDNEVVPTVGINGTYSRFRYAPSVNAFLLVSTVDGPVWGYKAGAMPGTGPNGDDSGSESGTADDGSSSSNGDGGSTGGGGSTGDDGTSSTGTGAAEGSGGSVGSSRASDDDDASSCACTSGRGSGAAWNFAWMLALAIARRRPVTACRQRACAPPRAATPARVVASTRA